MDFLTQLFTALNTEDSIKVIAFLFVSFLIGWIFCHWARAARIRRLKKNLKDKQDELVTLSAKYNTLVEEFELKDADLKKAQLAQEEAQGTIERLEREHRQIGQEYNVLRQQSGQFQEQKEAYETQIERLNAQIIGLSSQNSTGTGGDTSTTSTGIYNPDLSALENSYKHHDTRLELLEAKLNNLSQENQDLKASILQIKSSSSDTNEVLTSDAPSLGDTNQNSLLAKAAIKNMIGSRIVNVSPADKDNLQQINGIGPFIEEKLNQIGIYSFEQIEQFDDEIIEKVTAAIQFFPGRIKRDDWVGQASELFNTN